MKDAIEVLLKLDVDADDFYSIHIRNNEIWFQGYQSEKNLERFPDAEINMNFVEGYLYKEWKIGKVNVQVVLTPIV